MNKIQKKVILMYGIPASGKTTFAKELTKKSSWYDLIQIIDVDAMKNPTIDKIVKKINTLYRSPEIIIDGLFTTNKDVVDLFSALIKYYKKEKYEFVFIIHWWTRDIDASIHNDRGRRKQHAIDTIKNIPFEEPDLNVLSQFGMTPKSVIRHETIRKPEVQAISEELVGEINILESQSWSCGGTGCGYGEESKEYPISPETPCDFDELDDFLMKICPQISFLQYKKITRDCVSMETYDGNDYYSKTTHAKYVCDLKKLFKTLEELELEIKK